MARPLPSFQSATPAQEQPTPAELLARLNQATRTDAVRAFAPRDYRGGPVPRLKLWVGPEAIGAELLKNLNSEADRRVGSRTGELSRETLNRHRAIAHQKNRDRVNVFVNDLRAKGLLFLRVDIDGGSGILLHEGSRRGRKEIELLRKTGVISNIRHAKYYGPACAGNPNTYVSLPRDKVKSLAGLEKHARSFDQGARLELGLRQLQETPVNVPGPGIPHLPERISFAFAYAAKGLENRDEREALRREFEQAVSLLQQQEQQPAAAPQASARPGRDGYGSAPF
jgi:hypothetical protein